MSFSGPDIGWYEQGGMGGKPGSLRRLADSIDLGPQMELHVGISEGRTDGTIEVSWVVPDRDGGPHDTRVKTAVMFDVAYMLRLRDPRRWFIERVRQTAHELVKHEVDEWFKVNGERVYEPHR